MIPKKLLKPYEPKNTEEKIYKIWEKSGHFAPQGKGKPFCIIMPPANANGSLHAGHALVLTIEDIITRYKRMRGFKTLWLPGLDHAGFETQVVYEKELEKQGRSRFKMNPDELYKEIWNFTENNKKNIIEQTKKMGASCDWSREKYTLDKDIVEIVCETFEKLKKDGLVYRGKRIINWCLKHQTSLSDLETADTEQADNFYYLKYGPFTIATARPETKFGDKYVVVHPDDKRYKNFKHGQKINLEWINGPVTATVIKDKIIDRNFGTGAMTITPWHDATDFELSQRHNLEKPARNATPASNAEHSSAGWHSVAGGEQIIDFQGRLLPIAEEFSGMKILEARPLIIEKLKSKGLLVKVEENYKHIVKTCYKCGTMIEPQIKEQWFIKMKPLAEPAIRAIKENKIKFIPERFKKISLRWLENIIDWNISRQIVWGIKIPNDPAGDVFDTWFSSGQWPFATLMTSGKNDFKNFYPTSVMETAGEIIFFWVCRMIMFGLYKTDKIPFENVYLHGLVLDAHGKKMSKSRNNVINPLKITDKYGTDALRIGLVVGNTPATSLALDENKIRGYKNFANKIWNAARFVLEQTKPSAEAAPTGGAKADIDVPDEKYLNDFKRLKKEITKNMDDFKFYIAAEKIYHYFWHVFCDKIIEENKKQKVSKSAMREIFRDCLILLHPFMPFVTEEIYTNLLPAWPGKKPLIVENWPG